jgi:hypothetical protein
MNYHLSHSAGDTETTSRSQNERDFIGTFILHHEQVSSLQNISSYRTTYNKFTEWYVLLSTNTHHQITKTRLTTLEVLIRSVNKKIMVREKVVIPWLASCDIMKPRLMKVVTNKELKNRKTAFM